MLRGSDQNIVVSILSNVHKLAGTSPQFTVVILGLISLCLYLSLFLVSIYLTPLALGVMGGDATYFSLEAASQSMGYFFKASGAESLGYFDPSTGTSSSWFLADHVSFVHPFLVVPLNSLFGKVIFLPGVWVVISVCLGTASLVYAVRSLSLDLHQTYVICGLYFLTPHIVRTSSSSLFLNKGYVDVLSVPLIVIAIVASLNRSKWILFATALLLALTKEVYIPTAFLLIVPMFMMDRKLAIFTGIILIAYSFVAFVVIPMAIGVESHAIVIASRELGDGLSIGFPSKEIILLIAGVGVPVILLTYGSKELLKLDAQVFVMIVGVAAYLLLGTSMANWDGGSSVGLVGVVVGLYIVSSKHHLQLSRRIFQTAIGLSLLLGMLGILWMGYRVISTVDIAEYGETKELMSIQKSMPVVATVSAHVVWDKESILSARSGFYRFPGGLKTASYAVIPNNIADDFDASDFEVLLSHGFIVDKKFDNYNIWVKK